MEKRPASKSSNDEGMDTNIKNLIGRIVEMVRRLEQSNNVVHQDLLVHLQQLSTAVDNQRFDFNGRSRRVYAFEDQLLRQCPPLSWPPQGHTPAPAQQASAMAPANLSLSQPSTIPNVYGTSGTVYTPVYPVPQQLVQPAVLEDRPYSSQPYRGNQQFRGGYRGPRQPNAQDKLNTSLPARNLDYNFRRRGSVRRPSNFTRGLQDQVHQNAAETEQQLDELLNSMDQVQIDRPQAVRRIDELLRNRPRATAPPDPTVPSTSRLIRPPSFSRPRPPARPQSRSSMGMEAEAMFYSDDEEDREEEQPNWKIGDRQ